MRQAYEQIIRRALSDEEREWNVSTYDCEETPIEVALEDAETLPFFGERKIVIVKQPYFLTAEKGKEKVEHDVKRLEAYIDKPAPFSSVMFVGSYEKLDERKKSDESVIKKSACHRC